jgi:predicted CopG family antitoxin
MKKTQNTTIQITLELKKRLDSLKKYRRETYNDVLMRLIEEDNKAQKEMKQPGKSKKTDADIHIGKIEKRSADSLAELEY